MFRRATFLRCLMVGMVFAFASSSMWAQTSSKSPATQKAAEKKFRGRLPNNYGKIGLDAKQKSAIYAVQEKYSTEIDELEARIAELKTKQSEEILAILTAEQKTALNAIQSKSKSTAKA